MKKKTLLAIVLFLLFSTVNSHQKIEVLNFKLKKIIVENNFLIKEKEIKNLLIPLYEKNLVFLDNQEIEKALKKNSLIKSFNIKKKYPDTIKIKIYEQKPIAILFKKKKKFYLSETVDLIEFSDIKEYQGLPYVLGQKQDFKIFYNDLKKIGFPLDIIKKYISYESNRWDIETTEKKIIKLPTKNYKGKLKNYLELRKKSSFDKYRIFDYRINNQLILK